MALDLHEALETTLAREEEGLDLFREYREVSEALDRAHTQRYADLEKLFRIAQMHLAALTRGGFHGESVYRSACIMCEQEWPCDTARAQEFLDRIDLDQI